MSQLYFSRDVKVYVQTGTAIWEVPVLDGFSFSQATNSVEVTLNEMSSTAGISLVVASYLMTHWPLLSGLFKLMHAHSLL